MKISLLCGCFAVLLCADAFGAVCVPGNFQSFANLGAAGCEVAAVRFTSFTTVPGQTTGVPIDPADVQVAPAGAGLIPTLLFTVNTTAAAGEVFESFFRFAASDSLTGASIALTPPKVTGDAAVTGILDVCPNGRFAGGA